MLVCDGAYGTLLAPHLRGGERPDDLCLRAPGIVIDAHRAYLEAGAGCLQSNSFLAFSLPARRRADTYRAALQCMHEAASMTGEAIELRATMGPAGTLPREYYRDLELLLELEVPVVICETLASKERAAAFLRAWEEVSTGAPARAIASLSLSTPASLESWRWIGALQVPGATSLGINCCEGPAGLRKPLELLAELSPDLHVAPSAGLPGATLEPAAWAEQVAGLVEGLPVASVGGCCGVGAGHVQELVTTLG